MRWDDETAFEVFVDDTGTRLLRVAWLLVGERQRAEELVQRALRHTSRRWNRVEDPALHALGVITRAASRSHAPTSRRRAVLVLACHEDLPAPDVARVLHMGRVEVQGHLEHADRRLTTRAMRESTRFVRADPDTTWRALQGARRPAASLMTGR